MDLFPVLKAIVEKAKATLKVASSFNIFSNNTIVVNHIHLVGKDAAGEWLESKGDSFNLSPEKAPKKVQAEIEKMLLDYIAQGTPLLGHDAARLYDEVRANAEAGREAFETLKGIIPSDDLLALRAAYFIKAQYESGKPGTTKLKQDVTTRFGDRGRKLTNVVTSGYIESLVLPTYRAMSASPEYSVGSFQKFWNIVVEESAFAVFIHKEMSPEAAYKEISSKFTRNRSYGKYSVNIHGISVGNIKTVREAAKLMVQRHPEVVQMQDEAVGNSIFVRLQAPQK